jgi:NAD dependent epimerase/dehydratase family enzyme
MSWIHLDDEIGILLHALDVAKVAGPINATAPAPARNKDFARALGRALHRPAFAPLPGAAMKVLFGEMAGVALLTGQRALPAKAQETGYSFRYPELDRALRAAVAP